MNHFAIIDWVVVIVYLLTAVGVKICQIGVSYEDIGPKLLLQLRVRSPVMYCHYVRDDLSRQTMEKKGIRIDGVCPDLAFSAFESENSSAASAVTFSFRGEQYPNQIEDIKLFIHFFLKVTKHPGPFYFVTQVKKDKFTNEALANWFQKEFGQLAVAEDGSSDIESTETKM